MGSLYLRKYGVATTVDFCLYELDGTDLVTNAASATGDINLIRDEGVEEQLDADAFTDEGIVYSLNLSAAEMTAARITVYIIDQSVPKIWLDKVLLIETYGNASAQHLFDLGTATVNLSAASEAQIDAIETDTNEIQGKLPTNKIMGSSVVTDKDDEIDAIKTMTDKIGTITNTGGTATIGAIFGDFANTALVTRLNTIDDYIDTEITAIKTVTDKFGFDASNYVNAVVKAQDNIDFGALQKASLNSATPSVTVSDKTGFSLSAAGIDNIVDEVMEGTLTLRQAIRLMTSMMASKSSGGGTATLVYRDYSDTKARLTFTADADGNRTAVVADPT